MKIKDLDRNEVYGLEEIKKDSAKFDELKEWLKENDTHWCKVRLKELKCYDVLYFHELEKRWYHSYKSYYKPTKCALTLFELDITDYQVDCSDLSKEQIEEMGSVFIERGYGYLVSKKFALSRYHNSDFLTSSDESFYITNKQGDKTTITYDKFMELFGENNLVLDTIKGTERAFEMQQTVDNSVKEIQRGVDILDKLDKSMQKTIEELAEAFEQKPSQYQIGIDTFTRAEANMTKDEILACARFNIDKYTWRKKGQDKEDFEKIIAYANWALKNL